MAKKAEQERPSPETDVSTRLRKDDHSWLKENRGVLSIRDKVHEVIEFYKKQHGEKS